MIVQCFTDNLIDTTIKATRNINNKMTEKNVSIV